MARAAQVRETKPEEQDNANAAEDQDNVADAPAEGSDSPVLDLTDAAVKRLIKTAKARGYVTLDELNSVMPSEEVTSDQIEDIYSMLADMGITVVESEEETENVVAKVEGEESTETAVIKVEAAKLPPTARMTRCACTCARWGRSSFFHARAKLPLPSVLRRAARR